MAGDGSNVRDVSFWCDEWTEAMEDYFLEALADEVIQRTFPLGLPNAAGIQNARGKLNNTFHTNLSFNFCKEKVRRLQMRYNTFKWIIRCSMVVYDPHTAEYDIPETLWEYFEEHNHFAATYKHKAEPKFMALQQVFGQIVPVETDPHLNDEADWLEMEQLPARTSSGGAEIEQSVNDNNINPTLWCENDVSSSASFWEYVADGINDDAPFVSSLP